MGRDPMLASQAWTQGPGNRANGVTWWLGLFWILRIWERAILFNDKPLRGMSMDRPQCQVDHRFLLNVLQRCIRALLEP